MKRLLTAVVIVLCAMVTASSNAADELLTVGSKAPDLTIEHWLSNGNGNFKPVTKFQPGKIYVVEFWATWCGPCIQGMPHLAELQKEYAEKGVQFIGVSTEDVETVQEFLSRPVRQSASAKAITYGELTSVYSLTTDPDESTYSTYMQGSFQSFIPTAFIVGKQGVIEWIGSPFEMDEVLRDVVAGNWKREAYGKQFIVKQKQDMAIMALSEAIEKQDFPKAIKLLDERIAGTTDLKEQVELRLTKVQIELLQSNLENATKYLKDAYAGVQGKVALIDSISWHIFELSEQKKADLTPLVKIAYSESEKALSLAKGESRGSLLDTVSHLAYKQGDTDKAIKYVREAITFASAQNKEYSKQFLDMLLKQQAAKDAK